MTKVRMTRQERKRFRQEFLEQFTRAGYPEEFEFKGITYTVAINRRETPEQKHARMIAAWDAAGNPSVFEFEGVTHQFASDLLK